MWVAVFIKSDGSVCPCGGFDKVYKAPDKIKKAVGKLGPMYKLVSEAPGKITFEMDSQKYAGNFLVFVDVGEHAAALATGN